MGWAGPVCQNVAMSDVGLLPLQHLSAPYGIFPGA